MIQKTKNETETNKTKNKSKTTLDCRGHYKKKTMNRSIRFGHIYGKEPISAPTKAKTSPATTVANSRNHPPMCPKHHLRCCPNQLSSSYRCVAPRRSKLHHCCTNVECNQRSGTAFRQCVSLQLWTVRAGGCVDAYGHLGFVLCLHVVCNA